MERGPAHRGSSGDQAAFAQRFVRDRLKSFEKDMKICLTPLALTSSSSATHAYFPALGACCGTAEYLTGLHRGNLRGIGWRVVADWAATYMTQPDYDRDTIRVLFQVFRHPVAHRGISSGVWVDQHPGEGGPRRLTWKVLADARRPACHIVAEAGELKRDPPWPCAYTHRVHIHLRRLWLDIRDAGDRYADQLARDDLLQQHFKSCMRQLYPA